MSALSDALQIRHFTCARGSTVERPFLEEVARSLGMNGSKKAYSNKDKLLFDLIEMVSDEDPDNFGSEGGTITNEALAEILDGVMSRGLAKVSLTDGGAAARIALALFDEGSGDGVFDPLDMSDERKRSLREVVVREGQGSFRNLVFNAYGGRCAISRCDVPEVLQAAHIRPYKGTKTNFASNGILLRSDLHRLWDTGLLALDETTLEVKVHPRLDGTDYGKLNGTKILLPSKSSQRPSLLALAQQRKWAGF